MLHLFARGLNYKRVVTMKTFLEKDPVFCVHLYGFDFKRQYTGKQKDKMRGSWEIFVIGAFVRRFFNVMKVLL